METKEKSENANSQNAPIYDRKSYFVFLKILTLLLLFLSGFIFQKEADIYYRIGYGIGSALSVYLICFCLACIIVGFIKNKDIKKKSSVILILIMSLIYSGMRYFSYQSERKEIKETLSGLVSDKEKAISTDTEIKQLVEELRLIAIDIENKSAEYMNNFHLNGILKEDDAPLIQSKEGLKTLYDRGTEIIGKLEGLDIKTDLNTIYSQTTDEFYKNCTVKHPNKIEECKESIEGFMKGSRPNIDTAVELLHRKINVIHLEYDAIKCMYEQFGTNNCDDLLNKYMLEEEKFETAAQNAQDMQKQEAMRKLKTLDEAY